MKFVSSKSTVKGHLEGENVILGPTAIGDGSLVGLNVMLGYPARSSIKSFRFLESFNIGEFDQVSKGSKVGRNCVIRSGSMIYENAEIGDEVQTGHNVLVREGSIVGDKSRVGSSTQLDGTVKIGKNVVIQSSAYLPHLSVVEDDVFIAPRVCLTNDPYPYSSRLVGVTIARGARVGANSCIIAGVRVGENAMVAAGSVVTRDVPPNTVVAGNPARFHRTLKEYDEKKINWEQTGKLTWKSH